MSSYISFEIEDDYEYGEEKDAHERADAVAEEQLGQVFRAVHATDIPL
jgi:hypothetical protein